MSLEETQAFFEAYRDAFNRLDGNAVADLWHGSSGITDSGITDNGITDSGITDSGGAGKDGASARLTWWTDDAAMRANHIALCAAYRDSDYGRADLEIEQHLPLGPNHAFALLRWTLQRSDGSLLQRFHTGYQLMRTTAGPRVLLAVAHQENLSEMKDHAAE